MNKDAMELLANMGVDTKGFQTNSQMDTSTANQGAELVDDGLSLEVMDMSLTFGSFLPILPGNHGTGLKMKDTVDIIGETGFFEGGTEKTTGAFAMTEGNDVMPTDEIDINQKQYVTRIDVTKFISDFNVLGEAGFLNKIKEKLAKGMARTIEASILNGDTETGATGNVNLDDSTPPAKSYYLKGNGLRKVAIAASQTTDIATMDEADFLTLKGKLGDYTSAPEDCLWLFNSETYTKALGISSFLDASKNGKASTIEGKAITNIFGIDVFTPRDLKKTEADAKISVTPGNNTLGQVMLLWKPAVQFGFHGGLNMKLYDFGASGYQLEAWYYFGYAIVNKLAGTTDPTVWIGRNATL